MGLVSDLQSIGDHTPSNAVQDPTSPKMEGKISAIKQGLLKPVALSKATAKKRNEYAVDIEG